MSPCSHPLYICLPALDRAGVVSVKSNLFLDNPLQRLNCIAWNQTEIQSEDAKPALLFCIESKNSI